MTCVPMLIQISVAVSTYLAALSAGGLIAYPSVLIQQLKSNDTLIELDLHKGSWIGSVHGLAGIFSILTSLFMEYKGRKYAFIVSCIITTIGWILAYLAKTITALIIAECFHGIGGNSLLTVSLLSMSEMVQPKYRNSFMMIYGVVQAFGITCVGLLGNFFHWKSVALIMSCPIILAIFLGCTWLESPSWLAHKGKLRECKLIFERLRGTDEDSSKELLDLLNVRREKSKKLGLQSLLEIVVRKDFYLPIFHTFILLSVLYWGGSMPVIIYSTDMVRTLIGRPITQVKLVMDTILFVGYNITAINIRYFSSKYVFLISMSGSSISLLLLSVSAYLQTIEIIEKESFISVYILVVFIAFASLGTCSLGFNISSEIMPIKYRGVGGGVFTFFMSVFHWSSLKSYPYLALYLNFWGVCFLYSMYTMASIVIIWIYVPNTRKKTLQEIEGYYVHGKFTDFDSHNDIGVPFMESDLK